MVNGKAIRRRREKLGLTQAKAAEMAGPKWSLQRWSDFERDKYQDPRISTLAAVARVLKCKVDDLLRKS